MVYDNAHALASELANCEEYKSYKSAKEKAFADETQATLLNEYRKLSMSAQAYVASGHQIPEETAQKLQKLYAVLILSKDCVDYLMAEYNFHAVMGDVFKILTSAVDLDLGFLRQ